MRRLLRPNPLRGIPELGPVVPDDRVGQAHPLDYVPRFLASPRGGTGARVLDLGCGAGDSVDAFRAVEPTVRWTGLDLEDSPEVRERRRTDAEFEVFDGVSIPFGNAAFDGVYCQQVLEHVELVDELLAEVRRVLAPGGWLFGSTSQLEPYHSRSTRNYTPYGLAGHLARADLELVEVRPGMDAFTLIARRVLGRPGTFDRWWRRESPVNRLIGALGGVGRWPVREVVAAKLLVAGQFCFLARAPDTRPAAAA